jgi:glycosyltransferase involved in cell wall biosynthesis
MARISVIIPAFNRVLLLQHTLRSLVSQTWPAFEIIVVDDGSTDGTAEMAEKFGHPVRVIRQHNQGPAAARNRGFYESSGDYIHFFDSDDIALANKHEVQLQALEKSGADIAYGPWVKGHFSDSGFHPKDLILQQRGLPSGNLIKALLTDWSIVPHACLFRRTIVEKVDGFPENLFIAEDQLMFLRCLLAGAKVIHSPDTLELYRADNTCKISNSTTGSARRAGEWAKFLVEAANQCHLSGINPSAWSGFRRRAWEAKNDLTAHRMDLPELSNQLQSIAKRHLPDLIYNIQSEFQRKRSGLRFRMGRGRAHPCFQAGSMNLTQKFYFDQFEASLKSEAE